MGDSIELQLVGSVNDMMWGDLIIHFSRMGLFEWRYLLRIDNVSCVSIAAASPLGDLLIVSDLNFGFSSWHGMHHHQLTVSKL